MNIINLLIYLMVFFLILRNPIYILYVAIIDSMMLNRFYDNLFGIPFGFFFVGFVFVSFAVYRKPLKIPKFKLFYLFLLTLIYYFVSNWIYFEKPDFTILNNVFLLLILASTIDSYSPILILKKIMYLYVILGLIISVDVFIPEVRIFGNTRQIGFYLIIALIYNIGGRIINLKNWAFSTPVFFYLSFSIIASFGRLNLSILLIILFYYYYYYSQINLKLRFYIGFISVFLIIIFGSNYIEDYFMRNQESIEFSSLYLQDKELRSLSSGRTLIFQDGFEMFKDNYLFGYGYLSFKDSKNLYNSFKAYGEEKISMHSVLLQYLSETGLVGLSLYYLCLILLIKSGYKYRKLSDLSFSPNGKVLLALSFLFSAMSIAFIIGSLLDNHGIQYKHFFILSSILIYPINRFNTEKVIDFKK